jgi:hypothetical protein
VLNHLPKLFNLSEEEEREREALKLKYLWFCVQVKLCVEVQLQSKHKEQKIRGGTVWKVILQHVHVLQCFKARYSQVQNLGNVLTTFYKNSSNERPATSYDVTRTITRLNFKKSRTVLNLTKNSFKFLN